MLKTNSKKTKENLKNYIVNNFDGTGYTETQPGTWEEIAPFIIDTFRSEKYHLIEDIRYYHGNECAAFLDWCAGLPSVLDTCYYYNRSAVDDLGAILEETENEKSKFTEQEAEKRLTLMIYNALIKEVNKK